MAVNLAAIKQDSKNRREKMNTPVVNILIVDDKKSNIFALETLLALEGRNFFKATSGNEALKILLHENVDLILLDVHMPEMDGFEVAQLIKSNKRTQDIPIIFASAEKKEHEFIMKGLRGGAVDYLPKPLDPDITRAKVDVLLKIQLQKRELIEKDKALQKAHDELELRVHERTMELEKTNTALKNTLQKLERTNQQLEEFAYVATHTLRAPMVNLKSLVELYDNPEGKENVILNKITFTVNFLNSLLNSLIELTTINEPATDKKNISFSELLDSVKNNIKDLIDAEKAKIISDFTEASSITYPYLHLQSILMSLITNSIRFRSPQRNPVIKIKTIKAENFICLSVKDNGIGIDLNKHGDKLFRAFQRLDPDTRGKGLGLYIIKSQVELFGGRVEIKSEVGKGSTFYVYIRDNPTI